MKVIYCNIFYIMMGYYIIYVFSQRLPHHVKNHLKGHYRTDENHWEGRAIRYSPRRKLPEGNLFNGSRHVSSLKCDSTDAVGTNGHIYFKLRSKRGRCYHAFLGSRRENCTVAIFCNGTVHFKNTCDKDYLILYDGVGGFQKACGTFTFNNIPRVSRNNGTDMYIYVNGTSNGICVAFCAQDLTNSHALSTYPITINKNKSSIDHTHQSCECGKRRDFGRVVGGKNAIPFEFPWIAGIIFKSPGMERRPYCAGALISDRFVISAAHCFRDDPPQNSRKPHEIQVLFHGHVMDGYVDESDSLDNPEYQSIPGWDLPPETDESEKSIRVDVIDIISHPLFTFFGYDWDVALVKLKTPLDLSSGKIAPICLPLVSEVIPFISKDIHTIAGWGHVTERLRVGARILQKLDVPYEDTNECRKYNSFSRRHICAGYVEGGRDACQGDSGGPMIYKFKPATNQYILSGIVSSGVGCARASKLGLYTNVQDHSMGLPPHKIRINMVQTVISEEEAFPNLIGLTK